MTQESVTLRRLEEWGEMSGHCAANNRAARRRRWRPRDLRPCARSCCVLTDACEGEYLSSTTARAHALTTLISLSPTPSHLVMAPNRIRSYRTVIYKGRYTDPQSGAEPRYRYPPPALRAPCACHWALSPPPKPSQETLECMYLDTGVNIYIYSFIHSITITRVHPGPRLSPPGPADSSLWPLCYGLCCEAGGGSRFAGGSGK